MSDEFPKPSGDCITDRIRQNRAQAKAESSLSASNCSTNFCCWVVGLGESLCRKPATHREPMTGWTYCPEHAKDVADLFGYDQIDLLANDGTGNESHQSRAGGSPIKDSRPLNWHEALRLEALRLFRIVQGPGDAGSEQEFNCRRITEQAGWLRLAAEFLSSNDRTEP